MSRINQKMIKSKLVALSSELPNNYLLNHYRSGDLYHLEILTTQLGPDTSIHKIDKIISQYVGTISETYHTIRILYDVIHNINLGHDLRSE